MHISLPASRLLPRTFQFPTACPVLHQHTTTPPTDPPADNRALQPPIPHTPHPQGHAALGLSAADLSGGCVCCSKSEDLLAALHRIRDPSSAHLPPPYTPHPHTSPSSAVAPAAPPPDYLVVETSGAADAGPLAAALAAAGFRLDCVVAVVDAEAGRQALADHPVAAAQLAAAVGPRMC